MSRPKWTKELARGRIEKLFEQAKEEFSEHPGRSNRYMELAHKISQKYNVPMNKEQKKRFCPNCRYYWVPGETVRIRTDPENNRVVYRCLNCEEKRTHGYSREKKENRGK